MIPDKLLIDKPPSLKSEEQKFTENSDKEVRHEMHEKHDKKQIDRMEQMVEDGGDSIIESLDCIEENTHCTKKILKNIYEDVSCISEKVLHGLEKLDFNEGECHKMMCGCGNNGIVPTMPLNMGNNDLFGGGNGSGVLLGLLFGALFMDGGFFNRGRDDHATATDSITSAIDTNAILNSIQNTNADVLKASGDVQLATANQTNALQNAIASGLSGTQNSIASLSRAVAETGYSNAMGIQDTKYANTIATMNSEQNLRNAICAEGRQMDNQFARNAKDICQLGRAVDQNTFVISRQLDGMAKDAAACCCETQKNILESTYATSRQLDAMSRQNMECCCEQKLMNTMGFANVQNAIKDGFCDLKATLANEKIEQLRIDQASARDALNSKALADAINTTLTNGFTQLGAVFTSNVIPAIQSAVSAAKI